MVTEYLLSLLSSIVGWVFGLMPVPEPPAFLADVPGYFDAVSPYLAGTDVWIPWALLLGIIAAAAAALVVAVGIRLARIVASFLTLGGGS